MISSGTDDFKAKHVVSRDATTTQVLNRGLARHTPKALQPGKPICQPGGIPASSVTMGEPKFIRGGKYGTSKTSLVPRDVVTLQRRGGQTSIHTQRQVIVKGKTGHTGEVNHYDGTTRAPQIKAMAAGAGVQAATHIADHHIFKNAETSVVDDCVSRDSTFGNVGTASYDLIQAGASKISGDLGHKVNANANLGRADARTKGIPGTGDLGAAFAAAELGAANANAEASCLGVKASATATVGRVSAGFDGTPLQASASAPSVEAGAGIHANHIGAAVGAHAGEVSVGPFAARAGAKFGGGIENGVPVVHAGPVSAPCVIQ